MQKSMLRLLIIVFVTLPVPLQGVAAVTAGVCMALGHHDVGGAISGEHHAEQAPSDHHRSDGGTHAQHGSPAENGSDGSHCPPCVACCAAAAIAPAATTFIPAPAVGSVLPTAAAYFSGVTPEKLDRPPLPL